MLSKNCIVCGNEFTKSYVESLKDWNTRHKFCSRVCLYKWQKGKHPAPDTEFKVGQKAPHPIKKGEHLSKETQFQKGQAPMISFPKGHVPWNKGRKWAERSGEKHHNWKGGITPINKAIRHSFKYKQWRAKVFKRDNYQCVIGGKAHGNKIEADHIKSFSEYPKLRFVASNGRTLCTDCHKQTESYLCNREGKNQYSTGLRAG